MSFQGSLQSILETVRNFTISDAVRLLNQDSINENRKILNQTILNLSESVI